MTLQLLSRVILRRQRQLLPAVRSVSRDEAQYWLEMSKKQQDVYPRQASAKDTKLDHFDEFGPLLSPSVFKNKQTGDKFGYNYSGRETMIPDIGTSVPPLPNVEEEVEDKFEYNYNDPVTVGENVEVEQEVDIIDNGEQLAAAELPMETLNDDRETIIPNIGTTSVPLLNESRPIALAETISHSDEIYKLAHIRDPAVPSVSRILSATMSEESKAALARWEKEKIALLGLAGFKKLKADTFARGHTLHSMLETYMETKQLPKAKELADKVSKRHLVSISQTVKQFDKPLLLESAVIHPELNYCGIVDCVAVVGDTLALVDWKTSENVKNNAAALYDNPLQVAAYIGALNRDPRYSHLGNINNGVVVVVYNSGYPAMVHMFDQEQMEMYWEQWCTRLQMFKDIN